MVGRALIVCLVVMVTPALASAQALEVQMPSCAPSDVDAPLLRELLAIELGDRAITITLGPSLCDAARSSIALDVSDPASGREAHDDIVLPSEVDADPRAVARAIALAVAERAPRLVAGIATPPPTDVGAPAPSDAAPSDAAPSDAAPSDAAPSDATRAPAAERAAELATPASSPDAQQEEEEDVDVSPRPERVWPPSARPLTLGVGARGRIAPILPSWALGLRVDLGASFDATWSMRGELFATWSRATAAEGDVDAVVAAAAASFGATVFRDAAIDLVLAARLEAGLLVSMGWVSAASTGTPGLHPWIALGPTLDLVDWLSSSLAFVVDVGLSAVLYGTRLSTWPSGTQIDLSIFTVDLGAGLRFAL